MKTNPFMQTVAFRLRAFAALLAVSFFITSGAALAAPVLTEISPATGQTAGGTLITLTGDEFGSTPVVTIGGQVATVQPGGSDTSIVVSSPAGEGANLDVIVTADGSPSNARLFSYLPPEIATVSPTVGPTQGCVSITLTGANFGLNPLVTIGGSSALITSRTHGQITCILPAGQGSNRAVMVIAGGQVSGAAYFSYNPPVIRGLSPSSGPPTGGTTITLFGANFGNSATVTLSGVALPCTHDATYPHNIVTIVSPPGSGIGKKIMLSAAGQVSNSIDFNYSPPTLSSISPANGPTAGGVPITLTGANFGASPTVTVGGASATVLAGSSDGSLTFTLPAGEGLNRNVQVTSASGPSTNTLLFNYDPPAISGVAPATGATVGGSTITLTGTNFGLNPTVTIGGNSAPITTRTHGQITCILPAGQGSGREVRVNVSGQTSNTALFSYTAPIINSISPASGPIAGGTQITIDGSNFGTAPIVTFDGEIVPNTPDAAMPHNRRFITTPPGSGTGRKIAVLSGGILSNSKSFDYNGPMLTGIKPATGPTTGGTLITLSGANFGANPTVSIGGSSAPLVARPDPDTLVVALPAGQGADREVRITDQERQAASGSFSYLPPLITSINPASGPTAGNVAVTLAGQNFGTSPVVTLGGLPVAIASASHTQIVFILPQRLAGGSNLEVAVAAGNLVATTQFSYLLPPLTDTTDTDDDGLNDATELQLAAYGFDPQLAQPLLMESFLTGNSLFTPSQYEANRTAGQNDVTSDPNTYSLYNLSQIQALNIGTPLLQRDALGQFKLTIGVQRSTTLLPDSFQPFALDSAGASTSINSAGKLEFLFTSPDDAAFFRLGSE